MTDAAAYCREVEAYLCRKNDGHLIRVAGPAFDLVTGWAERGIPLKIVFGGVDRYFDRYYAKGPRRRPVRIEFCEADILDLFDEWRRAVGVSSIQGSEDEGPRSRPGLQKHVQRVIGRLRTCSADAATAPTLRERIDRVIDALNASGAADRQLRGSARADLVDQLALHHAALIEGVRRSADAARLAEVEREAHAELQPFHARMSPDAFERAVTAAVERLLREQVHLPVIRFE